MAGRHDRNRHRIDCSPLVDDVLHEHEPVQPLWNELGGVRDSEGIRVDKRNALIDLVGSKGFLRRDQIVEVHRLARAALERIGIPAARP